MGSLIDISNKKFGYLIAICVDFSRPYVSSLWKCKCDCGKTTIVPSQDLRRCHTTSCGCMKYKLISQKMKIKTNIAGKKFGRLTVIKRSHQQPDGAWKWQCKCECGVIKTYRGSSLVAGNTKSCGCFAKEQRRKKRRKKKDG